MKISALRDVCLATGLVLERKNYDIFDGVTMANNEKNPLPFTIKNIASIEPIPKHMTIEPENLLQR